MGSTAAEAGVSAIAGNPATNLKRPPLLTHPTPVALLASAAAALVFTRYPAGATAVIAAFVAVVLVVVAATDIERRIIPNRIVLPAIMVTLLGRVVAAPASSYGFVVAALAGGIVFLLPSLLGRSWMGIGDVKLIVLLGACLGARVVGAVTLAFLALFPVAVAVLVRHGVGARKTALPFGPFLAFGGLIILIVPRLAGAG